MSARLDDFRLTLGSSEYVPIMVGGMGVDISTAELALEACRLGGIGHISDAMAPFVSDRYFSTKYTKAKSLKNRALLRVEWPWRKLLIIAASNSTCLLLCSLLSIVCSIIFRIASAATIRQSSPVT